MVSWFPSWQNPQPHPSGFAWGLAADCCLCPVGSLTPVCGLYSVTVAQPASFHLRCSASRFLSQSPSLPALPVHTGRPTICHGTRPPAIQERNLVPSLVFSAPESLHLAALTLRTKADCSHFNNLKGISMISLANAWHHLMRSLGNNRN